ncbi:MAG TPA: Hsp20/alpha crystallin family protein [Thermodesulfovibrionales bacterium]|nr:Hsp20/alpha crystallin family protein [Thermodesulfovibrionales bacterium]
MTRTLFPFTRTSLSAPLLDEFDKFFNEFANSFGTTIRTQQGKNQSPRVNAFKKDGKYCIDAAVPLASKDDLDVEIEDNLLKIVVKGHQDREVSENDYIIREISRGQMTRILSLGEDIDVDSAKTSFKDGVLHIEFNARQIEEENKVRKLAIE